MVGELVDLRDHLERYRAVTLQSLELLSDEDLGWRPGPDHYTLGQQFTHIGQAEDFQIQGLLFGDWDYERVRFPSRALRLMDLRDMLVSVRARWRAPEVSTTGYESVLTNSPTPGESKASPAPRGSRT